MLDSETRELIQHQQQRLQSYSELIQNLLESEKVGAQYREVYIKIIAMWSEITGLFGEDRKLILDARKVSKAIRGDGDLVDALNENTEKRKPLFEGISDADDILESLSEKTVSLLEARKPLLP